jgi:hypothetical protein
VQYKLSLVLAKNIFNMAPHLSASDLRTITKNIKIIHGDTQKKEASQSTGNGEKEKADEDKDADAKKKLEASRIIRHDEV